MWVKITAKVELYKKLPLNSPLFLQRFTKGIVVLKNARIAVINQQPLKY